MKLRKLTSYNNKFYVSKPKSIFRRIFKPTTMYKRVSFDEYISLIWED